MPIDLANWMQLLDDSKKLSELSIPGTHDTGSRFGGTNLLGPSKRLITQTRKVREQLYAGIRFLDIRVRYVNTQPGTQFELFHENVDQQVSFDAVLSDCKQFLADHPRETIIMSIKSEADDPNEGHTVTFEARFREYVESNLWYLGATIPTLRDVRGKIVLFRRFGAKAPLGIDASGFKDNDTFTIDGPPKLEIQDQFQVLSISDHCNVVASSASKFKAVEDLLNKASGAPANEEILYVNFASGAGNTSSLSPIPEEIADYVNPKLAGYLRARTRARYGIVLRDFEAKEFPNPSNSTVNRSVGRTDITREIVRSNLPYGYWIVNSDGSLTPRGSAAQYTPVGGAAAANAVAIAATQNGGGVWILQFDGTVVAYGNAPNLIATRPHRVKPAISIAAARTPEEIGYWILTLDGKVSAYHAEYHGQIKDDKEQAVQIVATPDGKGYWILASGGRVYEFGSAQHFDDRKGKDDVSVAMATTPNGRGYWILNSHGRIHAFGNAVHHDDGVNRGATARAMIATPDGGGYWILTTDGDIYTFGNARHFGSATPDRSRKVESIGIAFDSFPPMPAPPPFCKEP